MMCDTTKMTTIISWNVNGLRSNILNKPDEKYRPRQVKGQLTPFKIDPDSNFARMVAEYKPDIVCLQETRCDQKVFDAIVDETTDLSYRYLNYSKNPARGRGSGYSGTAVFSRTEPINVMNGLPSLLSTNPDHPDEGRVITVEFDTIFVVNVYTPNSGTNEDFRINTWDPAMLKHLQQLKTTGKDVVIVGDMNVCREEIDIFSGFPNESQRIAGLLPEERIGITKYIEAGFVDSYRHLHPDEDEGFTWWNPRIKQFRQANKGWRLDYGLVTDIEKCDSSEIVAEVMGSDHCPIVLKMRI